jgi:hypothetical protein
MLRPARSHLQYQRFVIDELHIFGLLGIKPFADELQWITAFLCCDLSPIYAALLDTYSTLGRPALDPCDLFRSLLLMTFLGYESLDDWVDIMRRNPLYAIVSGFDPKHVPGATTLRDLIDRLYDYENRHERRKARKKLRRFRTKPTKKYKKGEKAPPRHPQIVAKLAARFVKGRLAGGRPEDTMNHILKQCFVMPSAQLGLLGNTQELILSGDGSQYKSGANPLGRKVCDCRKKGIYNCKCPRRFPDPDASWGWDSYHGNYLYGYAAYELTAVGGKYDLPAYILFAACQRHDSVSGLVTLDRVYQVYPEFSLRYFLGDSAHDALEFYRYLHHHNTLPIIDLNSRNKGKNTLLGDITIDELGHPVCSKGLPMVYDGACHGRSRIKWVCPLAERGKHKPECACTASTYGRTFYTKPDDDPRLHTQPPRGSADWKVLMAKRSGSERSNSRKKADLNLKNTRIRCSHRRFVQISMAGMVQHMNAWIKEAVANRGPVAAMLQQLMPLLPVVA